MIMRREYILVCVSAAAFLAAAAAPVYVYLETRTAERYVADMEAQLGSARSREVAARSTKQLLVDTEAARSRLEAASLSQDGAAAFIDMLERDARSAGVAFDIGGVSVEPKDGPLNALRVSMRGTGAFAAIMRLAALVETVPYASSVESLVLEREDSGAWSAVIVVSVAMRK